MALVSDDPGEHELPLEVRSPPCREIRPPIDPENGKTAGQSALTRGFGWWPGAVSHRRFSDFQPRTSRQVSTRLAGFVQRVVQRAGPGGIVAQTVSSSVWAARRTLRRIGEQFANKAEVVENDVVAAGTLYPREGLVLLAIEPEVDVLGDVSAHL